MSFFDFVAQLNLNRTDENEMILKGIVMESC